MAPQLGRLPPLISPPLSLFGLSARTILSRKELNELDVGVGVPLVVRLTSGCNSGGVDLLFGVEIDMLKGGIDV